MFPAEPSVRHLVYYILPVSGNGVWQRGVDRLRQQWSLFNGRKFIAVATGEKVTQQDTGRTLALDSVAAVRAYLPSGCDVFHVPNNPAERESVAWPMLFGALLNPDKSGATDDDAVLYAHSKATTRPAGPCQEWANHLYDLALDHWPEIASELSRKPIVGFIRKLGGMPPAKGLLQPDWYYSGNFWWARVGAVRDGFARIGYPSGHMWASEGWPGRAFTLAESGAIGPLHDRPDLGKGVYDPKWWRDVATPALARWKAEAGGEQPKSKPLLYVVTPVTRPHNLPAIAVSLMPFHERFRLRWLTIGSDGSHPDWWGAWERNEALAAIPPDAWVIFLDDDTLAHPRLAIDLAGAIEQHPDARGFVFGQQRPDGSTIPAKLDAVAGEIDTGMFAFRRAAIGETKWEGQYTTDHAFYAAMRAKLQPWEIVAIPGVSSTYNALAAGRVT